MMQQGVQDFYEEKENHSLEKEAIVEIHNIDNGNWFDISTDAVSEKIFSAFLFGILEELPEIKENSDTKTTEIYLKRHQIEKIIKNFYNFYEIESKEFIIEMVNAFKDIV